MAVSPPAPAPASRFRLVAGALALALGPVGCAGPARVRPPPPPLLAQFDTVLVPPPPPAAYPTPPPAEPASDAAPPGAEVARLIASAAGLVGQRRIRLSERAWRADCSGLVQGLFHQLGVDLLDADGDPGDHGVARIHRYVAERGGLHRNRPRPGDLVFFHDTYDRNRDGLRNDPLTHVGVVERVEADGTLVIIHHGSGRVRRARMNLERPEERLDPDTGSLLNDYLRRGRRGPRLTGELFAGFGRVLP